jgi:hypothetical protein
MNGNNFNVNFPSSTTHLKYIQINSYKNSAKNNNAEFLDGVSNQVLQISHQNICGLRPKTNGLLMSLYPKFTHIS